MKNKVKMLHCKKGITVKITMTKKRYEVVISIPKEFKEKEIRFRNKQVIFKFKLMKNYNEPIRIKMQRDYKVDKYGQICINNWSKFEFEEEGYYNGSISLHPSCYIPATIITRVKRYWKEYEQYFKSVHNTKNGRVSTKSKYTNYSNNNAQKPYLGGAVSPK